MYGDMDDDVMMIRVMMSGPTSRSDGWARVCACVCVVRATDLRSGSHPRVTVELRARHHTLPADADDGDDDDDDAQFHFLPAGISYDGETPAPTTTGHAFQARPLPCAVLPRSPTFSHVLPRSSTFSPRSPHVLPRSPTFPPTFSHVLPRSPTFSHVLPTFFPRSPTFSHALQSSPLDSRVPTQTERDVCPPCVIVAAYCHNSSTSATTARSREATSTRPTPTPRRRRA